jgi:hypothetical protein
LWRAFSSSCSGRRPMSIISSVDCFLLHEHMHHQLSSSSLSILRKSRNKGFNKCAITCDRLCYIVSHEEQNQPHIPAARRVFLLLLFAKCPAYYPMLGGRFVTKSFCADLIVWWERESFVTTTHVPSDRRLCMHSQASMPFAGIDRSSERPERTHGCDDARDGVCWRWDRRVKRRLRETSCCRPVGCRDHPRSPLTPSPCFLPSKWAPTTNVLLCIALHFFPWIQEEKASASGRWYTRQSCYSTLSHLDCPPYVAVSVSPCVLCGTRVIRKYNLNSSPQRHQAICYNSTQVTPHCHQACITICPCPATFIFI